MYLITLQKCRSVFAPITTLQETCKHLDMPVSAVRGQLFEVLEISLPQSSKTPAADPTQWELEETEKEACVSLAKVDKPRVECAVMRLEQSRRSDRNTFMALRMN